MSKTKNNHYIPRHIIENFRLPDNPMYVYDFSVRKFSEKSKERLFSGRRLWSQETEDQLNKEIDDKMAHAIASVRKIMPKDEPINSTYFVEIVTDFLLQKIFNKFILQILSFKFYIGKGEESILKSFFASDLKTSELPVIYIRVNSKLSELLPYVLIDNMIFIDVLPPENPSESVGEICFVYPISPSELILLGNKNHCIQLIKRYPTPHLLNMAAIRHQNIECQVACGNKKYLNLLVQSLDFHERSEIFPVIADRNW